MKTVILNNTDVSFEACVNLMDDELREEVHSAFYGCSEQDFLDAYCKAHFDKYGVEFCV